MNPASRTSRVARYFATRYLAVYPLYFLLWVCAMEGLTTRLSRFPEPWLPSSHTLLATLSLIFTGAFLRVVDDLKDLDYDREHNPGRPLAAGTVAPGELCPPAILAAAMALLCSALISPAATALLVLALSYGLALWWVESRLRWVGRNPLAGLAVAYPGQLTIMAFVVLTMPEAVVSGAEPSLYAAPLVFAGAFLHLEFAKKTTTRTDPDPHAYSQVISPRASAIVAFALAEAAVLADILLVAPWQAQGLGALAGWLPLATAVLPFLGARQFLGSGREEHPQSWPALFLMLFYVALALQGAFV